MRSFSIAYNDVSLELFLNEDYDFDISIASLFFIVTCGCNENLSHSLQWWSLGTVFKWRLRCLYFHCSVASDLRSILYVPHGGTIWRQGVLPRGLAICHSRPSCYHVSLCAFIHCKLLAQWHILATYTYK